ncbi:hypothetical protein [Mycolicibacterium litorale]|jgi:hypothetical protein|uniref:Uncharacterized protein n=1 Tax=Mycolicibacterium litorale TaxID=758802 RepID=A0AAD1IGK1_9MYCO|nr:hypothetical protein [Mycolicibacterium litorale]MCV7418550.1 hypothetical protein [Mycolicibacterium litorale]TDY06053.1 hypothetical protein BCL50_2367 [Mycolicibacterium litorale]BBY14441.1 hypothetical protein MLIT_00330 [Mycolicibacterium litorale]
MTTPPGPPYHGGYGYPPPQPPKKISIGMVFVGAPVYIALNSLLGFLAFIIAGNSTDSANVILGAAAVMLALIAFGGGAALLAVRNPQAKGIGLGLMVGWALTSLVTVGFCTGINPALYNL